MTLSDALEDYIAALEAAGRADSTRRQARRIVAEFAGFAAKRGEKTAEAVSSATVTAWLSEVRARSFERAYAAPAATYTAWHMRAVRKFFRHLVERNLLLVSPMDGMRPPKVPVRIPRDVLTLEEIRRLLEGPDTSEPLGLRDRAILELMYSSGLRRAEIARLDLGDADFEARTLFVREAKGIRDRVVPVGAVAAEWLARYEKESRPLLERSVEETAFFLTWRGKRFKSRRVFDVVTKARAAAKIERTVSPHMLRHTCATHLVQAGCDIRHVQALLGHEDLRTTAIYTRVAPSDLADAHRKFHPRAAKKPVPPAGEGV